MISTLSLTDVHGKYNVNGFNLENDLMRYDKPNKIIGAKTFNNLEADVLKIDKPIEVQGVDIKHFASKAILKEGSFKLVGKPYIRSATFEKGLR